MQRNSEYWEKVIFDGERQDGGILGYRYDVITVFRNYGIRNVGITVFRYSVIPKSRNNGKLNQKPQEKPEYLPSIPCKTLDKLRNLVEKTNY